MVTTNVIYCDNQAHIDDAEWPHATWKYDRPHEVVSYWCEHCKRLSSLIYPTARRHFERLPVGHAGTPTISDEGNHS